MTIPETTSGADAQAMAEEIVARARAVIDATPDLSPEGRELAHKTIDLAMMQFMMRLIPEAGST